MRNRLAPSDDFLFASLTLLRVEGADSDENPDVVIVLPSWCTHRLVSLRPETGLAATISLMLRGRALPIVNSIPCA
jgi:hypothetical protein